VNKADKIGLVIHAEEGLGLLHRLTGVIMEHQGNITSVAIIDNQPPIARIYFEIDLPAEGTPGQAPYMGAPAYPPRSLN